MPFEQAKHTTPKYKRGTPADHLPWPRDWAGNPVGILFLCSADELLGLVPFETYPIRQEWSEKDLLNPLSPGKSIKDIDSFFQRWLFFAFLYFSVRYIANVD